MGHFLGQPNESSPRLENFGAHILFVSITAHIVATVKKLYEILHISVRAKLFLILKFRLTFKLILKINVYKYKIQQILHA